MGVDKLGIGNKGIDKLVGISLKNETLSKMAAKSILPAKKQGFGDLDIQAVRALSIAAKGPDIEYQNLSGKKPLERNGQEILHDVYATLTGNKSKEGYPQDAQKSLEGIAAFVKQKEEVLASAVGFKPQKSSNLSGNALVNNLADRLGQVTRLTKAYQNMARFTLPGRSSVS
jgi:hypothetical protein